jgi:predicted dinucleotide-binding enzyme
MGSVLALRLAKGPYRLLLVSRTPQRAEALAAEIRAANPQADAEAAACSYNSCWEADIILLAIPNAAEREVAEKIAEVVSQKVVVNISSPLKETSHSGSSAALELAELLPNAKVIKASLDTTFAGLAPRPSGKERPIDALIAGSDKEALETVLKMFRTAGFHPRVADADNAQQTEQFLQPLANVNTQHQ